MKRFIKNNLKVFVAIIISGIIFGGIGVYAASQYFARDISFTPINENFKKENGEPIDNVEDALNLLYLNNSAKIIESHANTANGTTINVEIGSLIIVSAPGSSHATNTETLVTNLQGGSTNGIGTWTCVFKATDTNVKITADNNNMFSYIIIK